MTATVFRQSYMTQRSSLFTLINYCAIVFSFAPVFANGWLTACDGFYDVSACWLSHMKTINHWPLIVDFYFPILSCFSKLISVFDPNPVLVKIIPSRSENYPKVYYDAQHTFLCSVYFASWGKITAEVILPLAADDWLKWSHDKFGMYVLLSWPWLL